jgi:hypothetical protein
LKDHHEILNAIHQQRQEPDVHYQIKEKTNQRWRCDQKIPG